MSIPVTLNGGPCAKPARLTQAAGVAVILIGVLDLLGWSHGIAAFTSVIPGFISMNPVTALAFIFSGASLWLLSRDTIAAGARIIGTGFALIVTVTGALKLLEYSLGWPLGIDQWLFREKLVALAPGVPNRIAPNTAANFLLLGSALLCLNRETRRGHRPAQSLALAAALIAFLALIGYLYGVRVFYGITTYIPMALNTAMAFLILSAGLLLTHADRGLMAVVTNPHAGGQMARRLLPAVIGVLMIIGWLRLAGQQAGLYETAFGTALLVVVSSVILGVMVWGSANALNRMEAERAGAQEELTKQTAILQSVLTSIGEGVIVADREGKFLLWNPTAEQLIGLGPTDRPREEWSAHYGVYLPDQTTPYPPDQLPLAKAIRGLPVDADEQFLRRPAMPQGIWLSVTGRPLTDEAGAPLGGVVVFNDITARKQHEQEIKKLNADLQQRARDLETANKELEAFSYSVSHDLRAPLRGIDGFSQALLEDYAGKLDEQGRGYLNRVRAASQRMAQLIDDMLTLSRVTRTEMQVGTVDLSALVQTLAAELQAQQPDRRVTLAIQSGVMARGDGRLLRQVLENLLSNAWKFTSKRPTATIQFGVAAHNGATAYFVRDDGTGFDMAYAGKLFGAFQRLHAVTDFPGTGIGLATVQRIIHRHGGRVWGEAEEGKGATFYFTIGSGEDVHHG